MMHQTFRRMRCWSATPVDNQPALLDCLVSDAKSIIKKVTRVSSDQLVLN